MGWRGTNPVKELRHMNPMPAPPAVFNIPFLLAGIRAEPMPLPRKSIFSIFKWIIMRSLNAFSTRFLLQLIAKKKVRLERATFIHVVQLRFLNETKETRVYSLQEYYLEQGTQCQVLYLQFIVVDLSQLAGFAGNTIVI